MRITMLSVTNSKERNKRPLSNIPGYEHLQLLLSASQNMKKHHNHVDSALFKKATSLLHLLESTAEDDEDPFTRHSPVGDQQPSIPVSNKASKPFVLCGTAC
ncbi:hypothetical protein BT69DRAFT_402904 [Atractiella rhizophila]|nr:hypothetical protein BT69DRAFT_402904 [Atractiella rhizophila]